MNFDGEPVLGLASESGNSVVFDNSVLGDTQAANEFDPSSNTGDTYTGSMELLPAQIATSLRDECDTSFSGDTFIDTPLVNETVSFDTWTWPHNIIQPQLGNDLQAPWSTWTTNFEQQRNMSAPKSDDRFSFRANNCLELLHPSSEVVKHTSNLVMQALRSYPLMMLRRETLPPFIHPHWHRQSIPALPEPISNCMSIAHMYTFRSEETKPFLWRTITTEHKRFRKQVPDSYPYFLSNTNNLSKTVRDVVPSRLVGGSTGKDNLHDHAVCGWCTRAYRVESAAGCNISGQQLLALF